MKTVTPSPFDTPGSPDIPSYNTIEKRVWIKASAGVVYKALTASKELAKWFCDRADCNPCEGGELIAFWKTGRDGQKGRAIFTRVVPNASLELLWVEDGRDTGPGAPKHTLRYTIKSKSGMTEVVMVDHDDAAPDEETYTFLDRGWNAVLLELKDFCERKERAVKLRRPGSSIRSPEDAPEQSGGPAAHK
jgi:uncharacterized protein YndB with AHSA1/START domain